MREILFRGKNVYKDEWIYGDLRHVWDIFKEGLKPCIVPTPKDTRNNNVCGVSVIPETVGQYTGLTDKNGTRIFEGDIIQFRHLYKSASKYKVIFDEYRWNLKDFYSSRFDYPTEAFSEGTEFMEVIVNIHDNPELLETN